ncbi:MAG TPA: hypothetical protein VJ417_12875, partial [Candidatus Glassbacteria bacterium]|nr:hypothetical protein [Candidatus Glassbacteria bacterium]
GQACAEQLKARTFEAAFQSLETFQLDPQVEPVEGEARRQFDDSVQRNLNEIAAEVGLRFRLDAEATQQAALKAWTRHMNHARYDEAGALQKRHRLPLRMLRPAAKRVYNYCLGQGYHDVAVRLRQEYQLEVGFWATLLEWLRRLFAWWS